jgi:hypothetical protein
MEPVEYLQYANTACPAWVVAKYPEQQMCSSQFIRDQACEFARHKLERPVEE